MVADIVDSYRLKRAGPHMQSDRAALDTRGVKLVKQSLRKVQARRGRGNGTGTLRVNCLIALLVGGLIGPFYICLLYTSPSPRD